MPFYKEGEILWIVLLVTLGLDPYTYILGKNRRTARADEKH